MNEIWRVEVAVPVPLRMTFTYRVPDELDPTTIEPGQRVLVPFRHKLRHGVIMGPAYRGADASAIRALVACETEQRILAPEIMALLDWLAKYYRSPIGEAVKLALPPGVLSEKEASFRITESGRAADVAAGNRPLALLGAKPLTRKAWEALAQAEISFADIRRWERDGLIAVIAEGETRRAVPHVKAVRLTPEGAGIAFDTLSRAPRQRAMLKLLREETREVVALSELAERLDRAPALIRELEKRGYCEKIEVPEHQLLVLQQYVESDEAKVPTPEQQVALEAITAALETASYSGFLMFGVTGAGKTEVYLRAIRHCLDQGRQALFLVPEIALTPLMQRRIMDRFGERLAILHSAVGSARRAEDWARVLAGKVDVVLGARSGIFAPLPRLGLVIVDEEHDQSYKQSDGIRYHARDLALVRASRVGATVVLGSATPSLESWHNHQRGRLSLLTLRNRATNAPLPAVEIVDMREEFKRRRRRPILSERLQSLMGRELDKGHQVMILLNRRGYFAFMLCRKCGEAVMCSQCEVSLTYHRTDHTLKCHYCGETRAVPTTCPSCNQPAEMMQFFGEGTQQIQETIQNTFPGFTIDRLDRDRLTNREAHQKILANFEKGLTRILVGTQMIAKGHDFPNVTLVGIVNADMGLRRPDFRCAEVTFQLLTQVAGRSGRGQSPGWVVIQTYMPDHYSITCAAEHDFPAFLQQEMRYRETMFYSPFAYLVAILVTHRDEPTAQGVTGWMGQQLINLRKRGSLTVLGPVRAPIGKIKGAYRYQIVLKSADRHHLHTLADSVVEEVVKRKLLPRTAIIIDIDPYQFF